MTRHCGLSVLIVLLCGDCNIQAQDSASTNSKLDTYFVRYCDYTGGMGIGFVASHSYDFKFRQHLKETKDPELKRLFVLQHLYGDLDVAMSHYERGEIRVGKAEYRKMTLAETVTAKKRLMEMLDDLEKFDPRDSEREIAEVRTKLK